MGVVVPLFGDQKDDANLSIEKSKYRVEARANPTGDVWAVALVDKVSNSHTKERRYHVLARCKRDEVYQIVDVLLDAREGRTDLSGAPFVVPGSYHCVRVLA